MIEPANKSGRVEKSVVSLVRWCGVIGQLYMRPQRAGTPPVIASFLSKLCPSARSGEGAWCHGNMLTLGLKRYGKMKHVEGRVEWR